MSKKVCSLCGKKCGVGCIKYIDSIVCRECAHKLPTAMLEYMEKLMEDTSEQKPFPTYDDDEDAVI